MDRSSKSKPLNLPVVRIGDYIIFRHQKPNDGWLTSEGLLSEECFLSKSHDHFEDNLWQVHIQGQYSALQEYEEALSNYKSSTLHEHMKHDDDYDNELEQPIYHAHRSKKKSREVLSQLFKAAANENRLNEKLMEMKLGKAINYGDIIQLKHVQSGKFLSVSDHILAKQERENLRVSLQEKGSANCYLVFVPKFKYDREGQTISDTTEVLIRVHDRFGEYIHAAKKPKPFSTTVEVNCSLESSSFSISIYQQHRETSGKSILAGQLISLQEPESSGSLAVDRRTPGISERAKVVLSHIYQSSGSNELAVGTNLLWLVEKENFVSGGKIVLKNHRVTLRDLNSGLYMKQEADRLVAVKDKSDATPFEIHSSMGSDTLTLQKNSSVQLSSNGRWLSLLRVAVSENARLGIECNMATTDRSQAVSLVVNASFQHKYGTDLYVGVQATMSLRRLELLGNKLDRPDGRRDVELISEVNGHIKMVFLILNNVRTFLSSSSMKSIVTDSFDDNAISETKKAIIARRKVMAREQGLIEALLALLDLASRNAFDVIRNLPMSPLSSESRSRLTHKMSPRHSPPSLTKKGSKTSSIRMDSPPYSFEANPINQGTKSTALHQTSIKREDSQSVSGSEVKPRQKRVSWKVTGSGLPSQSPNDTDFEPPNDPIIPTNDGIDGSGASVSLSRHFDFHPITESDEKETSHGQIPPSTIGTVQSAIRTIGRRASSLFTASNSIPILKNRYSSRLQAVEESDSVELAPLPVPSEEPRYVKEEKSISYDICEACLKVLHEIITDNHVNQSLVADHLSLLLHLAKSHIEAVRCIQELLLDNLQILQTKVRQREINMFLQLLMESEMNVTYLRLLQNACSSPMGVDSIQRMVALALFGKPAAPSSLINDGELSSVDSRIMTTSLNSFESKFDGESLDFAMNFDSKLLTLDLTILDTDYMETSWPYGHIYFDTERNFESDVRGLKLFTAGLRRIGVSWKRKLDGEYTMMKLFGSEDPISLEVICSSLRNHHEHRTKIKPGELSQLKTTKPISRSPLFKNNLSRKNMLKNNQLHAYVPMTASQQLAMKKTEVGEYLVQQLYVVADVCLDRNYVAMRILENIYEYDMLISILKSTSLSNKIKAPVARIIRTLHLDRYPQEVSKYPRLIRLASGDDLEASFDTLDRSSFRMFHLGTPNRFGILQEVISEYLHNELDTCKSDQYSVEMTQVLQSLLDFGFYVTHVQIHDIIGPLIETLDHHRSIMTRREIFDDNVSSERSVSTKPIYGGKGYFHRFKRWSGLGSLLNSGFRRRSSLAPTMSKIIPISNDSHSSNRLSRGDSKSSVSSHSSLVLVDKTGKTLSIEFRYLHFIESATGMTIVLCVVITTIIIVFIQIFSSSLYVLQFTIFNYCVTAFFALDIILRILCFYRIHDSLLPFFQDFFNSLDTLLVVVDLLLIAILSGLQSGTANAGRAFRAIRAVRLLRLIRAASLVRKIAANKRKRKWELPKRYSSTTLSEAKTVVNIIRILSMIYHRIQNRHIGVIIKAFKIWSRSQEYSTFDTVSKPAISGFEIYQQLLISENGISSIIPPNFDEVLKDIVMYNDATLTEEALHLLMIHKNHNQLLLNVSLQVHVIFTKLFEDSFRSISSMFRKLKQLTEMYEVWQSLQTEEDRNSANEVLSIIHRMQDLLVTPNYDHSLAMQFPYLVDDEIQIVLHNVDGLSCFMFMLETFYDGGREIPSKTVTGIMMEIVKLVCWFVKGSPENQAEAFKHIDWFVNRVDDNINSASALSEILHGNKELIKQCPRHYITEFAKKIATKGHRPEYLELFVGMTSCAEIKHNASAAENEIAKLITSREWQQHILLWCSSPNTRGYEQRREAMEKYSLKNEGNDEVEDELPSDISYHVKLLSILAGCNLGPKLQAVYPVDDILCAILDPATILSVKIGLSRLLISSVTSGLDSARYSEYLWKFLDKIISFIDMNTDNLVEFLHQEDNSSRKIIDRACWLEICIEIVLVVFQDFNIINFSDMITSDEEFKYSRRSEEDIILTIQQLFMSLYNFYETHSSILGATLTEKTLEALSNLWQHCDSLPIDVDSIHVPEAKMKRRSLHTHAVAMRGGSENDEAKYRGLYKAFIETLRFDMERSSLSNASIEMFESIPSQTDTTVDGDIRIEPFVQKITSHIRSRLWTTSTNRSIDPKSAETASWVIQTLRQILEKHLRYSIDTDSIPISLSDVADTGNSKIDYYRKIFDQCGVVSLCMDLIAIGIDYSLAIDAMKLLTVLLLRSGGCPEIQTSIHTYLKNLDSVLFFEYIKDSVDSVYHWVEEDFDRTHSSGGDEEENEDRGHGSESERSASSASVADKQKPNLIVFFFLQLICEGEFAGNKNIVREQSKNSHVVPIFESLSSLIDYLSRHCTRKCWKISITVLRTMLKLMSGPCKGNQDQLILHTELLVSLNRFMRVSRPPAKRGQRQIFQSIFMSIKSMNSTRTTARSYGQSSFSDLWQQGSGLNLSEKDDEAMLELMKETVIEVLRSAVEGQPKTSVVFERVTTTIEFNVLNLLLLPAESKYLISDPDDESKSNNLNLLNLVDFQSSDLATTGVFNLSTLQSKYLVFTETLGYHRSNLPEFVHDKVDKEIVYVEIIWKGEVHRVFFHVLDLCRELSDVSKAKVTDDIDMMSHELKLKEFVVRSRSLFKEAEHQHYLQSIGLLNLWGVKTRLTWLMFFNAVIMNLLILTFLGTDKYGSAYTEAKKNAQFSLVEMMKLGAHRYLAGSSSSGNTQTGDEPIVFDHSADVALYSLNIIQIVLAASVVALLFIGQVPVTFSIQKDNGKSLLNAFVHTAMDPLPVWYIGYLIITILGIVYNRLWLCALLLDWVILDSTTRYVLLAVRYPARQLLATMIIILIVVYVFATVYFYFFRSDAISDFNIFDMWEAFKLSIAYGTRGEYGISHEFNNTLGSRLVVDVAYYFIVLAILRHIFFAIIVDTFGKLRELKYERDMEANNTCFICGVERHDYDKLSHQGNNNSFADHRVTTHNPLHYLYYMMHIWKQPVENDNGIEIYVRKCLASGNVSWFPIGVVTDTLIDDSSMNKTDLRSSSWDGDDFRMNKPSGFAGLDVNSSFSGGHAGASSLGNSENAIVLQHIRHGDGDGSGGSDAMVDRLNAIQRQLSTLSDSMSVSGRSSMTSRQNQSIFYNGNSFDRHRLSSRYRMPSIFPQISETAEDEDREEPTATRATNAPIVHTNATYASSSPPRSLSDSFDPGNANANPINDVMQAIGSLSRSMQEISSRLKSLEDERSPKGNTLTSSSAPVLTSSPPMPSSKHIYANPASLIKNDQVDDADIKSPSRMVSQKSFSDIKSVSESGSEDDSTEGTPIESVNAKIERMRSNPFLNRDLRLRPNSPQGSSNTLQSLVRTSTIRQQNRETFIGPSKELIGISPKKDDASSSSRGFAAEEETGG
jgi:hypothetical protein